MKQNKAVLIFDQGSRELRSISSMLRSEDCSVFVTSLPLEAIHILQKNNIDIVITNQKIEGMDSTEFKELAEKIRPGVNIFLLPPQPQENDLTFNLKEFVQFIQNHIRTENRQLTDSYRFKDFFFSFADRLLQVFEVNDRYFFNNDHLVANLSQKIAIKMGLEESLVDSIHISALLRDIGKVGIHHQILDEKGMLDKDEFTIIKSHPINTVQILKQINFPWNVDSIITHHHEHYNGNGYPDGLKGREIPLGSRIISIVDSYVAMTTDRPYRKVCSREEAAQEILRKAGIQFDPEIVEVFLSILQEEPSQPTEKKQILALCRDEALSALIKLNLSSEEFEIIPKSSMEEALQHLKGKAPHLFIAEWEIFSANKFNLYNLVRRNSNTMTIPFITIVPDKGLLKEQADPLLDFIVKPLNIDELSLKLKSLSRKELQTPRPQPLKEDLKGVAGNLEDLGLADIIQVLNMGLKTAKVILVREKEKGIIYIKSGKIVNVTTGILSGHEAFFKLMEWDKGVFHIFHGHTTDETNVTMDTMTLLLEACRVMDERRVKKT